jgi:hypothetical protein
MFCLLGARRRFTALALSSFSVSAAWLLSGSLCPAFAEPTPAEGAAAQTAKVSLEDVSFEANGSGFPAGLPFLDIRLNDDRIEIRDRGSRPSILLKTPVIVSGGANVFGYPPARPTALLYSGPVSEAHVVYERIAGVDTLKDGGGKTLWTNAAQLTPPDLLLEVTDSGQASLKGKDGAVLWSGTLPVGQDVTSSSRSSSRAGDIYRVDAYGVHLSGINGVFTLTDGEKKVLWAGTLPAHPVILLRRGHSFLLTSPLQSASGSDMTTDLSFAVEKGEVTVEDGGGNVVGTRPIELLKVLQQTTIVGNEGSGVFGQNQNPRYLLPRPVVKTGAGIRYTFKDSAGKVVGQGTVGENKGLRLSGWGGH